MQFNSDPLHISIPSRWTFQHFTHIEALHEVDRLAGIVAAGVEALHGLYLRITDLIRENELTDEEVKQTLASHFPQPRISELIRVAHAPPEVYRRYACHFFGFKAALQECRGYRVNRTEILRRRQVRRAAERLVKLANCPERIHIRNKVISISAGDSNPEPKDTL